MCLQVHILFTCLDSFVRRWKTSSVMALLDEEVAVVDADVVGIRVKKMTDPEVLSDRTSLLHRLNVAGTQQTMVDIPGEHLKILWGSVQVRRGQLGRHRASKICLNSLSPLTWWIRLWPVPMKEGSWYTRYGMTGILTSKRFLGTLVQMKLKPSLGF